jgi:hypothetical protein
MNNDLEDWKKPGKYLWSKMCCQGGYKWLLYVFDYIMTLWSQVSNENKEEKNPFCYFN